MEMNRYLIAALYVMAGCVVAIPLKVQSNPLSVDRSAYRLIISDTVKVVSSCAEVRDDQYMPCGVLPDELYFPEISIQSKCFSLSRVILSGITTFFSSSNPIRAPEKN